MKLLKNDNDFSKIIFLKDSNRDSKFKKINIKQNIKTVDINNKKFYNKKIFYISLFFNFSIIIYLILNIFSKKKKEFNEKKQNTILNKNEYEKDFNYLEYENDIITDKMRKSANWILTGNEANFLNGLVRKYKPKNCLEVGVAQGGSSIIILNAIKDIQNSILVSLDLNNDVYNDPTKKTGYRVKEYFPELAKNWKLFTGDQPHKFLDQLNMKFDFAFLDTAHLTPGELINFIEILPFLNEKSLFVIHDITIHFAGKKILYPSNIVLYPSIYGNKILLRANDGSINNMGAAFLYSNQETHYLDYFLLLLNFWEYMPSDNQINDLRIFIKKYYKQDIYLKIFEQAVINNRIAIESHLKSLGKKE